MMKPTADDAISYLNRVAPDRVWSHDGEVILETFEGHEPIQFAFIEELHWLKNGVVGARGYALWFLDNVVEEPKKEKAEGPSKMSRVREIVAANPFASRKELIAFVVKDVMVSEQTASSYVWSAKKELQ